MKNRLAISLPANMIYIGLSLFINFLLVPFIVDCLGSTAYGFYSISNDFVTYANIVTVALNYMGCRYIAYSYHRNEKDNANQFFSSLFYGDIFLGIALTFLSVILVVYINKVINVPDDLLLDVKITFLLTFGAFIIQVIANAFTAGIYVRDRMDLHAVKNMCYVFIRAAAILLLYRFFRPRIYYVSLAVVFGVIFSVVFDIVCTKRMLPEIKISRNYYDTRCIRKLLSSGGWYSFVSMGTVLSKGVDLLIANQMVDSYHMGLLAVSKTCTAAFGQLKMAITNVFQPRMLKIYATESKDMFLYKVKQFMQLTNALLYVPLAGLTVFSWDFYQLWLPSYTDEELKLITVLTMWGILTSVMSVVIGCLPELYAIVNRLKIPTLANFFENVLAFGLTLLLLRLTSGNAVIIVSVSAVINVVYQFCFSIPYAAILLERSVWTFFPTIWKGLASYGVLNVVFLFVRSLFPVTTWKSFLAVVAMCSVLGYGIQYLILISKDEKKIIREKVSLFLEERRKNR